MSVPRDEQTTDHERVIAVADRLRKNYPDWPIRPDVPDIGAVAWYIVDALDGISGSRNQ